MLRPTWILLPALLAALAPAPASAGALDKARLRSASGTLTISESRCPQGVLPGSSQCGKVVLTEKFASAAPRTRSAAGRTGFPTGLRIAGKGSGTCESESPITVITGPDGSSQLLTGASNIRPDSFAASRVVLSSGRHGIRFAWLEPLTPSIGCSFFGEGRALALPRADGIPDALVSRLISPRVVKRSHFGVTIAGSQEWADQEQDTQIAGTASWRLRLEYVERR